jgi:hypothetical protein
MLIAKWLTDFLEAKVVRAPLMDLSFLEEVNPSNGRPLELVFTYKYH